MSEAGSSRQDVREWQHIPAWELHQEDWSGKDIVAAMTAGRTPSKRCSQRPTGARTRRTGRWEAEAEMPQGLTLP
jgi:hypothetical protein